MLEHQSPGILKGQHEGKVIREAVKVANDGLVEIPCANPIELCQVGIKHHPASTHDMDLSMNLFRGEEGSITHPGNSTAAPVAGNRCVYPKQSTIDCFRSGPIRPLENWNKERPDPPPADPRRIALRKWTSWWRWLAPSVLCSSLPNVAMVLSEHEGFAILPEAANRPGLAAVDAPFLADLERCICLAWSERRLAVRDAMERWRRILTDVLAW
jgi:hypothetical protein